MSRRSGVFITRVWVVCEFVKQNLSPVEWLSDRRFGISIQNFSSFTLITSVIIKYVSGRVAFCFSTYIYSNSSNRLILYSILFYPTLLPIRLFGMSEHLKLDALVSHRSLGCCTLGALDPRLNLTYHMYCKDKA